MSDPYFGFIFAAYAVSAATIGALILWVIVDRRQARAALERADRAAKQARRRRA